MRTAMHAVVAALAGAGGVAAALLFLGDPRPAGAASNDRYQDSIMATGAVSSSHTPSVCTFALTETAPVAMIESW